MMPLAVSVDTHQRSAFCRGTKGSGLLLHGNQRSGVLGRAIIAWKSRLELSRVLKRLLPRRAVIALIIIGAITAVLLGNSEQIADTISRHLMKTPL